MLIVGLTGSIGMGKTTIARHLVSRGVPVIESDEIVHDLYAGEAVATIEAAFPGTTADGKVDRTKLSAALGQSAGGFEKLEALIHPLVRQAQWRFVKSQEDAGARLCVLDIPLLFETGGDAFCDLTLVVSAPEAIQNRRVLSRPGMTPEKFAVIRARQMPDTAKRSRADHIIDTSLPLDETLKQVDLWLESIKTFDGQKYQLWHERYGDDDAGGAERN